MNEQLWRDIGHAVRTHTGVVVPSSMRGIVAQAARELGITDGTKLSSPELRERFLDRLFIGTSWFNREHEGIAALVRSLKGLARTRASATVTLWSAGCSTGQEPYSLAMALLDAGCTPRIIATDFHGASLTAGREARYSAQACARVPAAWRGRYFDIHADGSYRVKAAVRSCVRFERHNFATDPPIALDLDAVVCRNVLIYFERPDALAAVARLASACRDGGYLLLGALEAPLLWMSANDPRYGGGAVPLVAISRGSPLRVPPMSTPPRPARPAATPAASTPATTTASRAPAQPNPSAMPAILKSRELERVGDIPAALRVLEHQAIMAPLDAHTHLARGLLLKQLGRIEDAVRSLRAACFLDKASWLAPYQLAVCLERIGETDEALEAYMHAATAINAGGTCGIYPVDDQLELLAATTAHACRTKLAAASRRSLY